MATEKAISTTNDEQAAYTPTDSVGMPINKEAWEVVQRMAQAYASSDIVPQNYRGKVANCIIALQMAHRMQADPMQVMQSLYIVHGQPSFSSKFLIASFNQCGRFSALRYKWSDDRTECRAYATEKRTGEVIEGPTVTLAMAKAEGWSTKNGSKWQTMPELMMMYRAAAFLIRTYAPEISMGFQTKEEVEDIGYAEVVPDRPVLLTPSQMKQAKAEIEQGHATVGDILEKYPTLSAEQVEELSTVKPIEQ